MIVIIILTFLLFWIIVLSGALIIFGRKGKKEKDLLERREML
jgi:hypothetical protein